MEKQLILSLSRQFGGGGHTIGNKLAEHYGIPLYDRDLLKMIASERNLDASELERYDEKPRNLLFSRSVHGYSNSPEDNIVQMQFDYLKKKADSGESFIIIGRCSEDVLKEYPGLISFFILGDREDRIRHTMEREALSYEEAEKRMESKDKKRKAYHNHYCKSKWGDSRNYDLSINSSRLGMEESGDFLIDYIDRRMAKR